MTLIRKLHDARRKLNMFELGFSKLTEEEVDNLEREVEHLEQELARPVRTTEEVEDDTDTSDL